MGALAWAVSASAPGWLAHVHPHAPPRTPSPPVSCSTYPASQPQRALFTNRTLNLRSIQAIGYDMVGGWWVGGWVWVAAGAAVPAACSCCLGCCLLLLPGLLPAPAACDVRI